MSSSQPETAPDRLRLLARTAPKFVFLVAILLGLAFFLTAGTFRYWQAWVVSAVLLVPMWGIILYLSKHDPALLERRLQAREKEAPQKFVSRLGGLFFLALMVLPGFDRRWGWSSVPPVVVVLADVVLLATYLFDFWVMKVNSYASRTVEVVPGQKVISAGPYAIVRHPMYLALLVLYGAVPLALGSYWALLAYLPLPFIFAFRIKNEEEVLLRDLPGYAEYRAKVRFKVLPGLW